MSPATQSVELLQVGAYLFIATLCALVAILSRWARPRLRFWVPFTLLTAGQSAGNLQNASPRWHVAAGLLEASAWLLLILLVLRADPRQWAKSAASNDVRLLRLVGFGGVVIAPLMMVIGGFAVWSASARDPWEVLPQALFLALLGAVTYRSVGLLRTPWPERSVHGSRV